MKMESFGNTASFDDKMAISIKSEVETKEEPMDTVEEYFCEDESLHLDSLKQEERVFVNDGIKSEHSIICPLPFEDNPCSEDITFDDHDDKTLFRAAPLSCHLKLKNKSIEDKATVTSQKLKTRKVLQCSQCNYKGHSLKNLKAHQITHSNKCKQVSELTSHVSTYSNIRLCHKKRIAFAYLVYKLFFKKKKRCWVKPFVGSRLQVGAFSSMFSDLRNDDSKFFDYFRMSIKSFDELTAKLSDKIKGEDTNMRQAIPPIEMVAVTLRYLGSGCNIKELHYSYRIGHSTICQIIKKVCRAVWDNFKEEALPTPTKEKWTEISYRFEKSANFPNCLGAIDGKHVRIAKSKYSVYSIVLVAIADANYNLTYIDAGSYDIDSDCTMTPFSDFYKKLENNSLDLPKEKSLPGTEKSVMPCAFVGDEAFGLKQNVLRPFGGKVLTQEKKVFNYRLNRARKYVECAFGILTNKWGIFHRPLNVKLDFAVDIVKACCVLHNYVLTRDGYQFEHTLSVEGLEDIDYAGIAVQGGSISNKNRNKWADYFVSDAGKVAWQDRFV